MSTLATMGRKNSLPSRRTLWQNQAKGRATIYRHGLGVRGGRQAEPEMNNNPELNEEWYINTLVMPDSIIMRVDSGSPAHLKNRSGTKVP